MSKRRSALASPKWRSKVNGMKRVEEVQRGQRNEDTLWQDTQGGNRAERRRVAKAARLFDKRNGAGAADAVLNEAASLDPRYGVFVRKGDREGT